MVPRGYTIFMFGLDKRRLAPLLIVAFILFIAAAVAGSSIGVDEPDLGNPNHAALLVLLGGLLVTVCYAGYYIIAGK